MFPGSHRIALEHCHTIPRGWQRDPYPDVIIYFGKETEKEAGVVYAPGGSPSRD